METQKVGENNMKIYTGTHVCEFCQKEFDWEYLDTGYRKGMKLYVSPVYIINTDPNVAKCKRYVAIPMKSEYLTTRCPHCGNAISIECSESMMKELNS